MKFSRFTKLVCLFFPVIVCEMSARVENCQAQEPLFSELMARNMARLFFDNYIADDKTKIKTNFLYKNTLLNIQNDGGLNCASNGI